MTFVLLADDNDLEFGVEESAPRENVSHQVTSATVSSSSSSSSSSSVQQFPDEDVDLLFEESQAVSSSSAADFDEMMEEQRMMEEMNAEDEMFDEEDMNAMYGPSPEQLREMRRLAVMAEANKKVCDVSFDIV